MSNSLQTAQHMELVQGDDYLAVDGRAVTVYGNGVCWPEAVDTVRLAVFDHPCCAPVVNATAPASVIDMDGVFTPATTTEPAKAAFDVTRAMTLRLDCGVRRYAFEVRGLLASGSVVTLARGHVTVIGSFA